MPNKISLIGLTFGRIKVISDAPSKNNKCYSLCLCSCGNQKIIRNDSLSAGTLSCGCLQPETVRRLNLKHGHFSPGGNASTFRAWHAMKRRCENPSADAYKHYGGRGIKICDRWKDSYENFLEDMGSRPNGLTLERIDTNGNYELANCRWATKTEQARNRRNNVIVTANGKTGCVAELSEIFGVDYRVAIRRIRAGWSPDEVFEYLSH